MISEDDVNQAYNAFEESFCELAKIEDRQTELANDLSEYKDGSRKAEQITKKIQELAPKHNEAMRKYKLLGMKVDRIRLLLDVEKNAKGRD